MPSLFLKPVDPHSFFEKQASIAKMPDDDTKWPAHVLSNLHQQLPFLSQYDVDLDMQRIEPEAGFAFGHALLMAKNDPSAATTSKNPQNMVRIPIIVADRMLQPFHTFELGGNVYPLTAERIEASLLNPAMFQGPADQPQRQKSLIDQMYPPYQQRQGFGRVVGDGASSMGINKLSSANLVNKIGGMGLSPEQMANASSLDSAPEDIRRRYSSLAKRNPRVGYVSHQGALYKVSDYPSPTQSAQFEQGLAKLAVSPMRFDMGSRLPASVVLKDSKIKLSSGVNPQSLSFFQIQGTKYVVGIPSSVASKLEKEADQTKIRRILAPLMKEEVSAARSGRASPGMFLLFSRNSDGTYRHAPPPSV
jgi:hypothetical protein